jgi:hypothetical protein
LRDPHPTTWVVTFISVGGFTPPHQSSPTLLPAQMQHRCRLHLPSRRGGLLPVLAQLAGKPIGVVIIRSGAVIWAATPTQKRAASTSYVDEARGAERNRSFSTLSTALQPSRTVARATIRWAPFGPPTSRCLWCTSAIAMGIAVGLCRGGSPAGAVRGQVLRVCGEAWVKIDISKGSQDRDSSVPRRGWPALPASLSFPSRG